MPAHEGVRPLQQPCHRAPLVFYVRTPPTIRSRYIRRLASVHNNLRPFPAAFAVSLVLARLCRPSTTIQAHPNQEQKRQRNPTPYLHCKEGPLSLHEVRMERAPRKHPNTARRPSERQDGGANCRSCEPTLTEPTLSCERALPCRRRGPKPRMPKGLDGRVVQSEYRSRDDANIRRRFNQGYVIHDRLEISCLPDPTTRLASTTRLTQDLAGDLLPLISSRSRSVQSFLHRLHRRARVVLVSLLRRAFELGHAPYFSHTRILKSRTASASQDGIFQRIPTATHSSLPSPFSGA